MPLASYIVSLCLHIGVILLIWLWPVGQPLINMEKPVLISLVEGDPGGNKTPSPILGPMGDKGEGEPAPTPPAEKAEVAATAREETKAAPIVAPKEERPMKKEGPKKPEPQPKPKPEPKPEPKKEEAPVKKEKPAPKPEPKKEQPKKAEPKKEEPRKKQTAARDKKDSKSDSKKEEDAVQAALNQARRKATSRAESGDRGSSVERALAEARKRASGNHGGGGGEGSGPGGGGLHSVYIGQVMLAVRPNWGYASGTRQNLQCTILIEVSTSGEVQDCLVVRSSGNVQYDSSCINAIMRTSRAGDFPPPPTPEYQNLEMVFTLNELRQG